MLQALLKHLNPEPAVRPTRDQAELVAAAHRSYERDMDFAVRSGRGGWMIARLRKNGTFHSWVVG